MQAARGCFAGQAIMSTEAHAALGQAFLHTIL